MLSACRSRLEGPARRAPRLRTGVLLLWAGITALQTVRAVDVCAGDSVATHLYFSLLAATLIAAMWRAHGAWGSSAGRDSTAADDPVTPAVLLCVAVTVAMRLVEVCAAAPTSSS